MKKTAKQSSVQYRLGITTVMDERTGKRKIRFLLETAQSFASFVYELIVKEEMKGNQIRLKVEGLKPPQLSIPASGHAKFERDYENLHGAYDIIVEGIDGRTTTFTLHVASSTIKVSQTQRDGFVNIVLDNH